MQASIFKNNTNQAVRLPKQAAFPDSVKKVDVVIVGRSRVLIPENDVWDTWFDTVEVPPDFMESREQPETQEREVL
ncbi:MAG: type II toxin-antitoxin system VapB family antitoxin [Neisseria animaloris]|nr:type II toxin-antitoxin system VapB family antitoxin [Neisseria animaloris]